MTYKEKVEKILKDERLSNIRKIQDVIELECEEEWRYDNNSLSAQYGLSYWDERKAGSEQPTATDFEYLDDENSVEILNVDYETNTFKFRFDVFSLINIDEEYGYEDVEIKKSVIANLNYNKISNVSIFETEKKIKLKDVRYEIKDVLYEDIVDAMCYEELDFIEMFEIIDIIDTK